MANDTYLSGQLHTAIWHSVEKLQANSTFKWCFLVDLRESLCPGSSERLPALAGAASVLADGGFYFRMVWKERFQGGHGYFFSISYQPPPSTFIDDGPDHDHVRQGNR